MMNSKVEMLEIILCYKWIMGYPSEVDARDVFASHWDVLDALGENPFTTCPGLCQLLGKSMTRLRPSPAPDSSSETLK